MLTSRCTIYALSAEFYGPKVVPANMEGIIQACIQGDLDNLKDKWKGLLLSPSHFASFGRNDTCHPLLHASHRLHVEMVKYLLDQGMSPRQRGTVHPYTGDNMTTAELQGQCTAHEHQLPQDGITLTAYLCSNQPSGACGEDVVHEPEEKQAA